MNKRQRKKRLKKVAAWYNEHMPWHGVWKAKEQVSKEYEDHMEKVGLCFYNACYPIENLTWPT